MCNLELNIPQTGQVQSAAVNQPKSCRIIDNQITIIFLSSYSKALYRIQREPTTMMVLVSAGNASFPPSSLSLLPALQRSTYSVALFSLSVADEDAGNAPGARSIPRPFC